ncbi:hypothetical protein ACFSTC_31210 [Nonomuraea ferruginea]
MGHGAHRDVRHEAELRAADRFAPVRQRTARPVRQGDHQGRAQHRRGRTPDPGGGGRALPLLRHAAVHHPQPAQARGHDRNDHRNDRNVRNDRRDDRKGHRARARAARRAGGPSGMST